MNTDNNSKEKPKNPLAQSQGLVWIVSDEDGDAIQVFDTSEETVSNHCKKYGWTYASCHVFRDRFQEPNKTLKS